MTADEFVIRTMGAREQYPPHLQRAIEEAERTQSRGRLTLPAEPPIKVPKRVAKGNVRQGAMNGLESRYAEYLDRQNIAGEVVWYRFEGVKLRLADKTFYTPDFAVMVVGGALEMHEVKGFWRDDARVKIKVAASIYPFRFRAITYSKSIGWEVEEF